MADNPFAIPQNLRDASEQNLKQAHAAYEQLMEFVTKAMEAWTDAIPPSPITSGFKNAQGQVMEFAKENAEAAFAFAGKISNAMTLQDILMLQTQFAQDRMQAFVTQTQQLFSVFEENLQKTERSGMGASLGTLPTNPVLAGFNVAGFKDVQDRAVAIAKTNAESAFAVVEKINKAQNFQDLLTVQARFAQDQMQAFVTQTQELQRLIREALQKSARS